MIYTIELIGGPHNGRWITLVLPLPPILRFPRKWTDYTPDQAPPMAPPADPAGAVAVYELGKAGLAGTQLPPWPAYFFRMT